MKHLKLLLVLIGLFMTSAACSRAEESEPAPDKKTAAPVKNAIEEVEAEEAAEKESFIANGKEWELGFTDSQNGLFKEYVLAGETVDNWSELITVHRFSNPNEVPVQAYAAQFKNSLEQSVSGDLHFEVLKEDAHNLYYEFQLAKDPAHPDQYETARIQSGGGEIWFLHYAIKTGGIDEGEKEAWQYILSTDDLKSWVE
ncbi:hypothetical protein [Bacillus infantis]|uniref:Uncharacterized protein n=2 Tax=Bacillus infantis TaxID=324767 RepID=A0A5D4RMK2_9BACI|nr:hypothetical protein [Bacillus infantis]TYS52170.1 hypothetical protein FZD51_01665 [Bacillus infantis]